MNLVPRNRIDSLDSLFDDLFTGFPVVFNKSSLAESLGGMRVDIHENSKNYEIVADLPGVKKEDISISLENDILTVSASKETETEKKKRGRVIRRERSSGSISRSFAVSQGVKQEDISASFADGVLTVVVPKLAESDSSGSARKIAIS